MWWTYLIIAVILVVAELVYFRIADHFNIIDKPNERSSHTRVVLRGGASFSPSGCGCGVHSLDSNILGYWLL